MNTVILTPEILGPIRNGGIGTFVWQFARLLRGQENRVTIIFTGPIEKPRSEWEEIYAAEQIDVIHIPQRFLFTKVIGNLPALQVAEDAFARIPIDTQIIYCQDWLAHGFHLARHRRFQFGMQPILATVIHGPSEWAAEGMQRFPDDAFKTLAVNFAERYVAEHGDFVAAPSQYIVNWAREHSWKLPEQTTRVLGLPMLPTELATIDVPGPQGRQLVFYGRLETRKGIELFVEALQILGKQSSPKTLRALSQIVFLGKPGIHRYENETGIREALTLIPCPILFLDKFDSMTAQKYLRESAAYSLVVIPSLIDNFPYTVLESTLIPGISMIASRQGGIPEIINDEACLFDPVPRLLAEKIRDYLEIGPHPISQPYLWANANQRWLDFHAELSEEYSRRSHQSTTRPMVTNKTVPRVNVCVPYFNHGLYLPQLLESLDRQSINQFDVTVINDGSTDQHSAKVFQAMKSRYQQKSWTFIETVNGGLSSARNAAARAGKAEYLVFIDSDNVAAPNMVERMLDCIQLTGDDCLTCYLRGFEGVGSPYIHVSQVELGLKPALFYYIPLGNCPELGLFVNTFGDANFIIRRKVFEELGGFSVGDPTYRYLGYEDFEFLAQLAIRGYRLDVIPEFLFYYRYLPNSMIRTTNHYQNNMRVQRIYREEFKKIGLEGLVPLIYGLYAYAEQVSTSANFSGNDSQWVAEHIPWFVLRDAFAYKLRKNWRKILNRRKL